MKIKEFWNIFYYKFMDIFTFLYVLLTPIAYILVIVVCLKILSGCSYLDFNKSY